MKPEDFKIGDKVLITKSEKDWVNGMDKYIGKIATLKRKLQEGKFRIDLDDEYWQWAVQNDHFTPINNTDINYEIY